MADTTKIKISNGLLRLMEKTDVSRITVKSLIQECGISRQTFYYHFKDIDDALEWTVSDITDELINRSLKADSIKPAVEIFVSSFADKYPMLKKLMESSKRARIEEMMIKSVRTYLERMVMIKRPDLPLNYTDLDMLLCFDAYGLIGTLIEFCGRPNIDNHILSEKLEKIFLKQLDDIEKLTFK